MIEVTTRTDKGPWKFDTVTKWHVDESGHLHLQYPSKAGNAATFAPGEWLKVVDASTDPRADGGVQ